MRGVIFKVVLIGALLRAGASMAAEPIVVSLKNHRFVPDQITAPAGQTILLQVRNLDATPEEFESYDIKLEKLIAPHATVNLTIRPLKPGVYKFFGDFNPTLAKGVLTVVAPAAPAKAR